MSCGIERIEETGMRMWSGRGLAVLLLVFAGGAQAERAYVPNTGSGTISVIDTATDQVVATWPQSGTLGQELQGTVVDRSGKTVLVVDGKANTVLAVAAATGIVQKRIPAGDGPEGLGLSRDGKTAAACAEDSNQAVFIDALGLKPEFAVKLQGKNPEHCIFSPDNHWLLASNENSNDVDVIDIAQKKSVALIKAEAHPRGMGFTPDGKFVYIANEGANLVQVVAVGTWDVVKTIPTALRSAGILVNADGSRVYVANGGAGTVSVIDTASNEVIASVTVGQRPWNMALTHDGKKLYVANGRTNDVSVIDTGSNQVLKTIAVGQKPWGVAIH